MSSSERGTGVLVGWTAESSGLTASGTDKPVVATRVVQRADVFPGAAAVQIAADGTGPSLSLRLSKKEGISIQLFPEGTAGASVVAVKRVDELGFYNLGTTQLAKKVGLTVLKLVAVGDYIGLRRQPDCSREIKIGRTVFKRYSPKAIDAIKEALKKESVDEIWRKRSVKAGRTTV